MAYTPTTWTDNTTQANAARLNKLEQGVKEAHDLAEAGGGGGGGGGVTSHGALTGRDAADQHPIGAITGLQDALDAKSGTGHTHTAESITGLPAAVAEATEGATLAYAFGATDGVPISPWEPGPAIGPNFWQAGNFIVAPYAAPAPIDPFVGHNGDGTLSAAPQSSGNLEVRAQCQLLMAGNTSNRDATYRLEFDLDASTVIPRWNILATIKDKSGDTTVGQPQRIVTSSSPALSKNGRRVIFDFKPTMSGSSFYALELRVKLEPNSTPGQMLVIENITLTQTGHLTIPLRVAYRTASGGLHIETAVPKGGLSRTSTGGPFVSTTTRLGNAGEEDLKEIYSYDTDCPYQYPMPDPLFERETQTELRAIGATGSGWSPSTGTHRGTNNDQILQVKSLNGNYEGADGGLYGNVHGGETNRESVIVRADFGAGLVPIDVTDDGARDAWRVQVEWNTQMKTDSDPAPFAHVDHLMTFFPDGMMRMDRATTFQRATTIRDVFEWMSSHPSTRQDTAGRIGRGLTVLGEVDYNPKAATPAAPSVAPSAGGSLPAGSLSYRVTALTARGETTASPATTATAAASDKATVSWVAVTGATGYRIYGRSAGSEALLDTVGPTTLSWEDDGTTAATGLPPTVNSAVLPSGSPVWSTAEGEDVTWAVQLHRGWCHGNIYDRDSVLSRDGVEAVRTRLMCAPGSIQKNYANLFYDNGSYEMEVAQGTEWTATHWSFIYQPRDLGNYHDEVAVRAASLQALKSIYPST